MAVAFGTVVAVLGAGCNAGSGGDPSGSGATRATAGGASTTAVPAAEVPVAVAYSRTYVAAPTVPHLWGLTGNLVVTVDGDLDAAGLERLARSLRALVRRARGRHDPVTGPRFFRLPPYTCRADRRDTSLERTAYRCDGARRRVTWTKT